MPRSHNNSRSALRGQRELAVRVRTAKGRKTSSTRWLSRQLNDPYVKLAKRHGYRSRSAFKLLELNQRSRFLYPGLRVIDLGSVPGGWSRVAADETNASSSRPKMPCGKVFAFDINPMEDLEGVTFAKLDLHADNALEHILQTTGGKIDVVLSDMAAPSTGHTKTDHIRIIGLCEIAFELARLTLCQNGTFLCKVLAGGAEGQLQKELKLCFGKVRTLKPPASRKDSAEKYVLATGFRGKP